MAIKSIAAAARELGYRSRSSLQNLMDDGYLDDFISLNEKGHRQLEMNGLRERVAQVVNWSDRNVVAKERLSRVDLETILRIGDYCNALCERYGWKTRHTAGDGCCWRLRCRKQGGRRQSTDRLHVGSGTDKLSKS